MEVFNNHVLTGYEEMASAGPPWWTEYLEMDANYRFAGWTLDLMAEFLDRLANSQFPAYCDENTLRMYEKILKIEYDTEMTQEERRRIVSAYWSGNGHMSRSVIETLVNAYTGQGAKVWWNDETLVIDFDNTETQNVSISMLQKILKRRMPAHIDYRVRCMCVAHIGISPAKDPWKMFFVQAGTVPDTNIGLAIRGHVVTIDTKVNAYKEQFPMAGDSEKAGTYPKTNIGLELSDNSLAPEVTTQSWSVTYAMCGAFEI